MFGKKTKYRVPKIGSKFMELFLPQESKEFLLGDFESIYYEKLEKYGLLYAVLWYWFQIFANAPIFVLTSLKWGMIMFNNYLKITFRNLKRNKLFSAINIGGLALGLAAFSFILAFIINEFSYDNFYEDSERIFRVSTETKSNGKWRQMALTPPGWSDIIEKDFAEIEANALMSVNFYRKISVEDKKYLERVFYSTEKIFDVFSYPLVYGDKNTALKAPYSIVLSETLAKKIFGNENPINKSVKIEEDANYKVTGVMRDLPKNSSLKFDFLISMSTQSENSSGSERVQELTSCNFFNYVKFVKNADAKDFEQKIQNHFKKYTDDEQINNLKPYLERIDDIYLKSEAIYQAGATGSIKQLYIMSGIALFILFMAGINFTNLTISTSFQKAKEIGIRKVNGGKRSDLIIQIIGDSIIVSFLAMSLAFLMIPMGLSTFNEITKMSFELSDFYSINYIALMISITLLTGFIAGIYPALFMSSFETVGILKGEITKGKKTANLRKFLVVLQFTASIVLIITTFILTKQIDYIRLTDKSFSKENVIVLSLRNKLIRNKVETLKTELKKNKNVIDASVSSRIMGNVFSGWFLYNEKGDKNSSTVMFADENYIKTLDLEIVKGRGLSLSFPTDKKEGFLVNESAVKMLGYDNPIGKYIGVGSGLEGKIVGVVKDFNFKSLHYNIEPLVIKYYLDRDFTKQYVNIKLSGKDTKETLEYIKNVYARFSPEVKFNPIFLDEYVNRLYQDEEKLRKVINIFSVIAVIIGCLGLFGLSAYSALRRKKEIGIRKVLGSSEISIVKILISEFVMIIFLAVIFAIPISYYIGESYLNSFSYRTDITFNTFLLPIIISSLIAVLTVGYHSIRAALTNPIEAIKYE